MYFSIMLSLLTIKTDYSYSVVRLDEIQAIEVVDIDRPDESGILTITLKGDKDDLVYSEMNKERWEEAYRQVQEKAKVKEDEHEMDDDEKDKPMKKGKTDTGKDAPTIDTEPKAERI